MESYLLSNITTCSSFAFQEHCVYLKWLYILQIFRKCFSFLEGSMEYLGLYLTIFWLQIKNKWQILGITYNIFILS